MRKATRGAVLAAAVVAAGPAWADDILDAIEAARKSYQSGNLASAKQSLDLASQLVGQRNADAFGALLPAPLPGWEAEDVQTASVGVVGFGASSASRRYQNAKGQEIEVQITGDSALIAQFAALLGNPQFAGAMGRIIRVGDQRGIQTTKGDVSLVVGGKFLVQINGTGTAADKLAYVNAIDVARLSKM